MSEEDTLYINSVLDSTKLSEDNKKKIRDYILEKKDDAARVAKIRDKVSSLMKDAIDILNKAQLTCNFDYSGISQNYFNPSEELKQIYHIVKAENELEKENNPKLSYTDYTLYKVRMLFMNYNLFFPDSHNIYDMEYGSGWQHSAIC